MKAMILAAGRGERMGSLTSTIPKPLTNVFNTTLIEHNIQRIRKSGITDIIINISWLGDKIKNFLGDGKKNGVNITYLDEGSEMLGTGGGILNALPLLGEEPFWLINADIYTDYKISLATKLSNKDLGHLVLVPNPPHHPSGDFFLEKDRVLLPKKGDLYTYCGISLLSPKLFSNCSDRVFPLEPLLEESSRLNSLSGEFYDGFWMDIGSQERLKKLEELKKSS